MGILLQTCSMWENPHNRDSCQIRCDHNHPGPPCQALFSGARCVSALRPGLASLISVGWWIAPGAPFCFLSLPFPRPAAQRDRVFAGTAANCVRPRRRPREIPPAGPRAGSTRPRPERERTSWRSARAIDQRCGRGSIKPPHQPVEAGCRVDSAIPDAASGPLVVERRGVQGRTIRRPPHAQVLPLAETTPPATLSAAVAAIPISPHGSRCPPSRPGAGLVRMRPRTVQPASHGELAGGGRRALLLRLHGGWRGERSSDPGETASERTRNQPANARQTVAQT